VLSRVAGGEGTLPERLLSRLGTVHHIGRCLPATNACSSNLKHDSHGIILEHSDSSLGIHISYR
jgi:hypothetical protein